MSADISIIVPTITGRERWLQRCLAAYKRTAPEAEVIVLTDEKSCGIGWRKGAELATRPYLHFTADDLEPEAGWWQAGIAAAERGVLPAAMVYDRRHEESGCQALFGRMGTYPNVLVPLLKRDWLELGDWFLEGHYGTDDWITYLGLTVGLKVEQIPEYAFVHHVAEEGRDYTRRPKDVLELVGRMRKEGYVPPAYKHLESRMLAPTADKAMQRKLAREKLHARRKAAGRRQAKRAEERARRKGRPARKIYAASPFKNELDVLEIRLGTIADQVDRFVIAEATVDQRGRPKELVFPQHRERFARWADKIEYVVVDDMPGGTTHEDDMKRERHQRDALIRGMPNLRAHDLVYVSDLDEIPYPEALAEALEDPPQRFGMDLHVYRLNWRWLDRGCRIGTLGAVVLGEDILRKSVCWAVLWDVKVPQRSGVSGWHLTYQGDVPTIRAKITGMMDKVEQLVMPGVDPKQVTTDAWIEESIRTGRDIFGRTFRPSEWVDLDELPPYVMEHRHKFEHMLVDRPPNQDRVEAEPRCSCGGVWLPDTQPKVLAHFRHCQLSGLPGEVTFDADNRRRARARDV